MALNYEKLDKMFTELLKKQTRFSLTVWLLKDRIRLLFEKIFRK